MAASLSGKKKKKQEEAELDITPMIDVTFLLLIFFMVTSTMQQEKERPVPPAKFGVGADGNQSIIITIEAEPGTGKGTVYLGDGTEDEATIERVKAYVQEGVNSDKKLVIIKADRDVNHGEVANVLKALADMDGLQFAVGVQEINR